MVALRDRAAHALELLEKTGCSRARTGNYFRRDHGTFPGQQPRHAGLEPEYAFVNGRRGRKRRCGIEAAGTDVTWVGRVGQDSLGELVIRELRAEGIDARAAVDPENPTGLMIKERRTTSSTWVWYYRHGSAGLRLDPLDLPPDLIRTGSLLHCTGITPALSPTAAAATIHAMETAHAAGVPISFDLNFRSKLWSEQEAGDFYRLVLPLVDIVFAGNEEAKLAVDAGGGPMETAKRLTSLGPSQAVIKLGEHGCVGHIDGVGYVQESVPVEVVYTVGAGGGFVAGYLSELLLGSPVSRRLQTAVTVGAFACMVPGDWEGMPFRSELGLLTATEPVSH